MAFNTVTIIKNKRKLRHCLSQLKTQLKAMVCSECEHKKILIRKTTDIINSDVSILTEGS